MSLVACNNTSAGLRGSEVLVTVHDINDRRHAIRVERDFLTSINGKDYLPIGVVHFDSKTKNALIEFSHEPETGVNRIWVAETQLDEPVEAYA